jgi:hypothetical protein
MGPLGDLFANESEENAGDDLQQQQGDRTGQSDGSESIISGNRPEHFDELGDTDPSTGAEDQDRQRQLMIAGAAGIGVVAVLIIGVGAWLLYSSGVLGIASQGGDGAEPTATVVTAPTEPPTEPPIATATATSSSMAVATMVPVQVRIEGQTAYADASYPYKARYDVTLARGEAMGAALRCDGCLTARDEAKTEGQIQRGAPTTFEVVAPPLTEVDLTLYVGGDECAAWTLSPSNEEATTEIACSPQAQ